MKLRIKLFLAASIPALITLLVILVLVFSLSLSYAKQNALQLGRALTDAHGARAGLALERAAELARALGQTIAERNQLFPAALQAAQISEQIRKSVERTPAIFAVWVILEPGLIPKAGAATRALFDPKNHYSVWWLRNGNDLMLDTATDVGTGEVGLYYTLPRDSGKLTVLNPTTYALTNGGSALTASVVLPLTENGRFVGVIGIDFSLAGLQNMTAGVKSFTNDYSFIISNNGILSAHPTNDVVGKPFADALPALEKKYGVSAKILAGEPVTYFDVSLATGQESLVIMSPFRVG